MPWKINEIVKKCGHKVPKLFYEGPGLGKEPLSILLGKNAVEVAYEVIDLSKQYALKVLNVRL